MLKTKMKTISAILSALVLALCCILLTSCGKNDLSQEASYDKNVNYSETVSAEESQTVIDAVSEKVAKQDEGALASYRFTMKSKDAEGKDQIYANMIVKDKELMTQFDTPINKSLTSIKNGVAYMYNKDLKTETETKIKFDMSSAESALSSYIKQASSSLSQAQAQLTGVLAQLKEVIKVSCTVTKNGNNFKFAFENEESGNVAIIMQLDKDKNINAIHAEATAKDNSTMEFTFSAFNGNIDFPNLDDYKDFDINALKDLLK